MWDENIVIIQGRMAEDAVVKVGKSGKDYCQFTIANNSAEDVTNWVRCVAFGETSQIIGKHYRKGDAVMVKGKYQTGSYVNNEGEKTYTTNVMVSTINKIVIVKNATVEDNPFVSDDF